MSLQHGKCHFGIVQNASEGIQSRIFRACISGYAPAANDDLGETHPSQTEHCEEGQQAGMEGEDAAVEKQHVHAVYEVIASHFSATRYAVWPKVSFPNPLTYFLGYVNIQDCN